MPETNGYQDNPSRLDRIEIAIEHIINEHEKLIDEHKRLLTAQVVMVESVDRLARKVDEVDERLGRRLEALAELVDRDHREYHARLNRLEGRP